MDESRLGSGLQQGNSLMLPVDCRIPEHGLQFSINRVGDEYVADVLFNAEYKYFKGHFDRYKLVPGACQLEIVKAQIDAIYSKKIIGSGFQKVKFKAPVRPGETVKFVIALEERAAHWKATSSAKIVSEGRFLFHPPEGA